MTERPLVAGLPRATWSPFGPSNRWILRIPRSDRAGDGRRFGDVVVDVIGRLDELALVGEISWTTLGEGEDAVIHRPPSGAPVEAAQAARAEGPDDADRVVAALDLVVEGVDGSRVMLRRAGYLSIDDDGGRGPAIEVVLRLDHDVHAPISDGLIIDNTALAGRNRWRLARFLESLGRHLGAVWEPSHESDRAFFSAIGFVDHDLAPIRRRELDRWERAVTDGGPPIDGDRLGRVLAVLPDPDQRTRILAALPERGRAGARARLDNYLAEATAPPTPGTGDELVGAASRYADQVFAVLGQGRPGPVTLLEQPPSGPSPADGDRPGPEARVAEIVEAGLGRHPALTAYGAACRAVTEDRRLAWYLVGPLLDPPLDVGAFHHLWRLGGNGHVGPDETLVWPLPRWPAD